MKNRCKDILLAIDIGNTSVNAGLFTGRQVLRVFSISANLSEKKLREEMKKRISTQYAKKISSIIICSVAPGTLGKIIAFLDKEIKVDPLIVGQHIKVPIKSFYNSKQIGQDRLLCAYAAQVFCGTPAIIIDLGTAITCDYVSENGEYVGGIIIPGLKLSAESLHRGTAFLPKVKIDQPDGLIGQNTQASILSGMFYGYGSLLDGLIKRIRQKYRKKIKVILTGGYADLMKEFMNEKIFKIETLLVLKGIRLLDQEDAKK